MTLKMKQFEKAEEKNVIREGLKWGVITKDLLIAGND